VISGLVYVFLSKLCCMQVPIISSHHMRGIWLRCGVSGENICVLSFPGKKPAPLLSKNPVMHIETLMCHPFKTFKNCTARECDTTLTQHTFEILLMLRNIEVYGSIRLSTTISPIYGSRGRNRPGEKETK
jgi:hypothetical protein